MFIKNAVQLTPIAISFPHAISQDGARVSTLIAFPSLVGKTKELNHIVRPAAIKRSFKTLCALISSVRNLYSPPSKLKGSAGVVKPSEVEAPFEIFTYTSPTP